MTDTQPSNPPQPLNHPIIPRHKSKSANAGMICSNNSERNMKINMMQKQVVEDDTSSIDSDSDSSSSLFSDDESVSGSEDEISIADEIKLLEGGIEHRRKLLSKILEGKEETAFAKTLKESEDRVNEHLLESLRSQLRSSSEEPTSPVAAPRSDSSSHNERAADTIKDFFTREFRFTLPGIISLITHCSLYLSIYGCISKLMDWSCDLVIIRLAGWHISENAFDYSQHEQLYHVVWLLIGVWISRMTGSLWAWNDNESFQQQLKDDIHSRPKSSWNMQMMRWFAGKGRENKCGPRMKSFLDTFSFFLVYLAVDKLLIHDFAGYALNSRDAVLAGMPSRQLKSQVSGISGFEQGGTNQCTRLDLDVSNDTSKEACLSSFVLQENFTSDVMNWLENRNRCRWVEAREDDDEDGEKFRAWFQQTEEWKQLINARDEQYLMENLSYKTYYELVGDPTVQFVDPVRENWFYVALTLGGFAVLFRMGSPFLLI